MPIASNIPARRLRPASPYDRNPLTVEGASPTRSVEQARRAEALSGSGGIWGRAQAMAAAGSFNRQLDRGLAAAPVPADDPALLAAAAREMQLRRMNRGRGGTVLTGTGASKLG